jgi:type III secretion protein J
MMNPSLIAPYARRFLSVIAILCCLLLGGCLEKTVLLLTEIPETEANDALVALLDAGIKAEKKAGKDGMVDLEVEQDEMAKAIATLHAQGLPHERFAKMGEVFRKEGLISSPLEERARYLWALSQEVSGTLSQLDGVIVARVQVVLPERSSGGDPALPSSAAVFIKFRGGYHLDETVPQIKKLVADSIPGLAEDKVSIVLVPFMPKPLSDVTQSVAAIAKPAAANSAVVGWLKWAVLAALSLALIGLAFYGWTVWNGKRRSVGGKKVLSSS